ncbi:MAG TPA: hypothetical protein VH482_37555 [Thermomicrobiales bacterium]
MKELGTKPQPRASVDDAYAKPWVARDAAKNIVKEAITRRQTPADMIDREYGIFRPDYAAVVGKLIGVEPKRAIAPDEIGVTGFAPQGDVFPLAEVWQQVTGEEMPAYQSRLVSEKPRRRRKGGA